MQLSDPRTVVACLLLLFALVAGCSSGGADSSAIPTTVPPPSTTATPTTMPPPSTTAEATCAAPATGAYTLAFAGQERSYLVQAPPELQPGASLLLLLHGFTSTPDRILDHSGLTTQGPAAGVLIVAPLATGDPTSWEIVPPNEPNDPTYEGPNDLGFLTALVASVRADFPCVGPVWAAGLSAGSAMAAIYMCSEPEGLVGVALVAALVPAVCDASSVRDMLIFHGTDDPVVPYGGGDQAVGDASVALPGIEASAAGWAELGGCNDLEYSVLSDDVELRLFPDCNPPAAVALHTYIGGSHNWPGGSPDQLPTVIDSMPVSCLLLARIANANDVYADCGSA